MDLKNITVEAMLRETANAHPTPGGGSAAALAGALGASLCAMAAGITLSSKKYQSLGEQMRSLRQRALELTSHFTSLSERDCNAYNQVVSAYRLPKKNEDDKSARKRAIQEALKEAAQVPMETLKAASEAIDLVKLVAEKGNPNCITDAGVAALLLRAAAIGAAYNVMINLQDILEEDFKRSLTNNTKTLVGKALDQIQAVEQSVEQRLKKNK